MRENINMLNLAESKYGRMVGEWKVPGQAATIFARFLKKHAVNKRAQKVVIIYIIFMSSTIFLIFVSWSQYLLYNMWHGFSVNA